MAASTGQEAYELVVARIACMDAHNCNMAIVPLEVSRGPWWASVREWLEEDGYRLKSFRGDMLVIVWD